MTNLSDNELLSAIRDKASSKNDIEEAAGEIRKRHQPRVHRHVLNSMAGEAGGLDIPKIADEISREIFSLPRLMNIDLKKGQPEQYFFEIADGFVNEYALEPLIRRVQRGSGGRQFEEDRRVLSKVSKDILKPVLGGKFKLSEVEFKEFINGFLGKLFENKLARYNPEKKKYLAWLKQVAINSWRDEYRKDKTAKEKDEAIKEKFKGDQAAREKGEEKFKGRSKKEKQEREKRRKEAEKFCVEEINSILDEFSVKKRVLFLLREPYRPLAGSEELDHFARNFGMPYAEAMRRGLLEKPTADSLSKLSGENLKANTITVTVLRVLKEIKEIMKERGIHPRDLIT